MQIEVHDIEEVAVGRGVERGGKESESCFTNQRVVFGCILPHGAERPPVRDRHVKEFSIGRDNDAVWPINVDGHLTGTDLLLDADTLRPKTNERDLVSRLGQNIEQIIPIRFCL